MNAPVFESYTSTSFEMNQSCPNFGKPKASKRLQSTLKKYGKFTGEEHDSYCYTAPSREVSLGDLEKSELEEQDSNKSRNGSRSVSSLSLNASWSSFPEISAVPDKRTSFTSKHSNKAVLIVDAKTTKILTANKQACILFERTSDSIIQMKLSEMFEKPYNNAEQKKAIMHGVDELQGNITVMSGNVREIVTKNGHVTPVSVWMKIYEGKDGGNFSVVVLENVTRITGKFSFNAQGDIVSCDDDFARIHGYPVSNSLLGISLKDLMPAYEVPQFGCRLVKTLRKQYVTSTTSDGLKFPLSVYLQSQEKDDINGKLFTATVWFFTNISGPLTITYNGVIQNVNSNFSLALLGYTAAELKNKNISTLLPEMNDNKSADTRNVSEECVSAIQQSSERILTSSQDLAASDTRSSFVNISLPSSNSSKSSFNSPSNPTLDRINSLLLGKSTPVSTPRKSNLSAAHKDESYGCAFGQRVIDDSWVEVSMNAGSNLSEGSENESDEIKKINLLLNGSVDALENEKEKLIETPSQHSTSDVSSCTKKTQHTAFSNGESPVQNGEGEFSGKENISLKDHENLMLIHPKGLTKTPPFSLNNVTSTPLNRDKKKSRLELPFREGHYDSRALHKDGSLIAVSYELRYVPSCSLYCIWISLDLDNNRYNSSVNSNQTLYSSFNSTLPSLNASFAGGICDQSLGAAIRQVAQRLNESSDSVFAPLEGTDEWLAIQGKFGESYEMRRAIGSGAFGFVRNAKHKKTNTKFVVKFIRKEKVLEECWVEDYEFDSMIPLEIALLAKFDHPNIVKVVDFFENDNYFSMVMPTHGANGMDLFEFIDREPVLNELIASYIFRQIASAVYFLHQEGVVHRDIKDENVIIDETFTCKLIDFGSAAFYHPGQAFGTFCGTVEYCSPEVLMGERYEGPALEVWALGVTLYTLVYGENPFCDIEESIEAKLQPPHFLSPELMLLIRNMLQPVPEHRYSIQDVMETKWVSLHVEISEYSWEQIVPSEKPKQSFTNVSTQSKNHLQPENESELSNNDSLLSSRETLADHLRKWNKAGGDAGVKESPVEERKLLPLTRRLENINLNHSI